MSSLNMNISDTELLRSEAVADTLGVSRQTLWLWRRNGSGPQFVMVGHRARYPKNLLDQYLSVMTSAPDSSNRRKCNG